MFTPYPACVLAGIYSAQVHVTKIVRRVWVLILNSNFEVRRGPCHVLFDIHGVPAQSVH